MSYYVEAKPKISGVSLESDENKGGDTALHEPGSSCGASSTCVASDYSKAAQAQSDPSLEASAVLEVNEKDELVSAARNSKKAQDNHMVSLTIKIGCMPEKVAEVQDRVSKGPNLKKDISNFNGKSVGKAGPSNRPHPTTE